MMPMATCASAAGGSMVAATAAAAAAVAKKGVFVCKNVLFFVLRWLCTQLGLLGGH